MPLQTIKSDWRIEYSIFILLLVAAAIARFWSIGTLSITNDEFWGIRMATLNSWGEIMEFAKIDGHPIGSSWLMWAWSALGFNAAFGIRFPFVLFGLGSVTMGYLIGRKWFGELAGLLTALVLALFSFPVLHTQLARGYSPGLFFVLLTTYAWTRVVFDSRPIKMIWWIVITFGMVGALYSHYFSGFQVFILGLGGFYFVRGSVLKKYLLCCTIAALLFAPHLPLTFVHLQKGGINWLSPPGDDFVWQFIYRQFDHSAWFMMLFLLLVSWLIYLNREHLKWTKFHTISLLLFWTPYAVAHIRSITAKPILHERVLLFSFLFLFLFLFSWVPVRINQWRTKAIFTAIVALVTYHFIWGFAFYDNAINHLGNYKEMLGKMHQLNQDYEDKQTGFSLHSNSYMAPRYYADELGYKVEYDFEVFTPKETEQLDSLLAVDKTDFYALSWIHMPPPEAALEVINKHYPVMVESGKARNHGFIFRSKDFGTNPDQKTNVLVADLKMNTDREHEYSANHLTDITSFNLAKGDDILIKGWGILKQINGSSTKLVMEILDKDDQQIGWFGSPLTLYLGNANYAGAVYTFARITEEMEGKAAKLKIYLWSPDKQTAEVDRLSINIRRNNDAG